MEKPAVIFNEQGWKLFLDFMRGIDKTPSTDNSAVDAFVKEYYEHKSSATTNKSDMTIIADIVATEIAETGILRVAEIQKLLEENGYTYELRGIGPVMRGVIKLYPDIKRVDSGVYSIDVGDTDE